MFTQYSERLDAGAVRRLLASMGGAALVYAGLGALAVVFLAGGAVIAEEKEVEVVFMEKAPEPPPEPPPTPEVAPTPEPPTLEPPAPAAPPAHDPRPSKKPLKPLDPPKPLEAPKELPQEPPKEADPSQETGSPPVPPGEGDPAGLQGGKPGGEPGGLAGGQPGGTGTQPTADPPKNAPVVLPAGAVAPEPSDPGFKPEYPSAAREARVEGEVVVKVIVHTDGRVELVKFIKSDPHFDSAVLAYLKKLRYKPAIYNGQAIAVYKNIKIPFTLK